jgi:serine/threonine-protein kinase RsbW
VASVPLVRTRLQKWMGTRGASIRSVDDARLVVSELVSNAVCHASPRSDGMLHVAWRVLGGAVEVSVSDGGSSTIPHIMDAPPLATSGRGLAIVSSIVDRLWFTNDTSGRTMYAVISLH